MITIGSVNCRSILGDSTHNPARLSVLQAIYVLQCLGNGETEQEIKDMLDGAQAMTEWVSFLLNNQYIEKMDGRWIIKDKDKERIEKHG